MTLLFVCTGNTCRSCMAEWIFKSVCGNAAGAESEIIAISRGLHAFDGDSASEHSVSALKGLWDIDASIHKAKILDSKDVLQADLVLTMTRQQRDALRMKYLEKCSSIFTLKEYAYPELDEDSPLLDISDPFGMPYLKYENCAKEIYDCVINLCDKIK